MILEKEQTDISELEFENSKKHNVVISNFEGPLDLLCFLISKNKMDIFDISLSELTDEYIKHLEKMQELNMEITTSFIVMASNLLYIKSKKLIPLQNKQEDEDMDTEEELIAKIKMYKLYKEKQYLLRKMYEENFGAFVKAPEKLKLKRNIDIKKHTSLNNLLSLYEDILKKNSDKINLKAKEIEEITIHEKITIKSKVKQIIEIFKKTKSFIFNNVFSIKKEKGIDIVTAFLSILELTRLKQVSLNQKENFSDITVTKIPTAKFDISVIKE